jgi:hypothetical protein
LCLQEVKVNLAVSYYANTQTKLSIYIFFFCTLQNV